MNWDESLFREVHLGLHRAWLDPFFWFVSWSALGEVLFVTCVVIACFKPLRVYALMTGGAAVMGGSLIAQAMKRMIPRDRPSLLPGAMPQEPWQFNAFPSGHTAAAFGVATMLALLTRGTKYRWVGRFGLVWATLVGLSRIYRGVHWPTDVLGGALAGGLGAFVVYAVAEQFLPEVAEHESATLED